MLLRQELVRWLVRLFLILLVVIPVGLLLLDMLAGNGIHDGYTFEVFWTLLNAVGKS
jgi:hypothetical protein